MRSLTRIAPIGRPPPSGFASVNMSGTTPVCSAANNVPVRPRPHCTSSKISALPVASQRARRNARKSVGTGRTPPSPCTGYDHGGRPLGDRLCRGLAIERDDLHIGQQRLEGAAIVRPVGGRKRREQPAVERAVERDDAGLLGPFARELERALVGFGARITEER